MYIYIKIIYIYYIYIYIYIYILYMLYINIYIYIYIYIHIQHSIHLCPDSVLYFLSYSWYFFSPTCISSIVPQLLSFNFYIFTQNLGRNMTYEKMYMYSDVSYLARSNSPGQTGWLSIRCWIYAKDGLDPYIYMDGPIKIIMRLQNLQYKITKISALLPI